MDRRKYYNKKPKQKKIFLNPKVERWIFRIAKYVLGALIPTIPAVVVCWLFPTYTITISVTIAANIIIMLWTLFVLFDDVMSHKDQDNKTFYRHNFIPFAVYAVPAIVASVFMQVGMQTERFTADSNWAKVYTFLFLNCKWLHYFSYHTMTEEYGIGFIVSALAYVAMYCVIIWLFPRLVKRKKVLGKIRPKKGIRSILWKRYYFT